MSLHDLNGEEWPVLPITVDLPPPKDHYTPAELAQNYATVILHYGQLWPRVVDALEYLRGHLIGAKGAAAAAARDAAVAKTASEATKSALQDHTKEVKLLREALQGQLAATQLGLPPMRPEAPSTVSMVDSITKKVSGEFQKIARESEGPYVEADPKRLVAAVEKAVAEELTKKEKLRKASEDAARLAAFEKGEADRKKLVRKLVAGFLLAIASAAGSWAWGKAQGHLEGKQAALDEARHSAVAVAATPSMPASALQAPPAPAAIAPAPPAAAPAAATRR